MANLSTFFDMIMCTVLSAPGTGSFSLSTAVPGFNGTGGLPLSTTNVSYSAWDGTNWETAHGVLTVTIGGGGAPNTYTVSRGVDTLLSSNSNSKVNFGANVIVSLTPLAQDLNAFVTGAAAQSLTATQQAQARSNIAANVPYGSGGGGNVGPFTNSSTGLMCGYGVSYTPSKTGNVLILINGSMEGVTSGNEILTQARYGTGAAPGSGTAPAGTQVGPNQTGNSAASGGRVPFCIAATLSSLTVGTAYWFDLLLQSPSGTQVYMIGPTFTIIEL